MIFLSLLVACSGGSGDTGSTLPEGDATAGADVYATNCASCHGASGEGGTGPAMAEVAAELDDSQIADTITNGTDGMPAFALADQDLADVVAYIRETYGR